MTKNIYINKIKKVCVFVLLIGILGTLLPVNLMESNAATPAEVKVYFDNNITGFSNVKLIWDNNGVTTYVPMTKENDLLCAKMHEGDVIKGFEATVKCLENYTREIFESVKIFDDAVSNETLVAGVEKVFWYDEPVEHFETMSDYKMATFHSVDVSGIRAYSDTPSVSTMNSLVTSLKINGIDIVSTNQNKGKTWEWKNNILYLYENVGTSAISIEAEGFLSIIALGDNSISELKCTGDVSFIAQCGYSDICRLNTPGAFMLSTSNYASVKLYGNITASLITTNQSEFGIVEINTRPSLYNVGNLINRGSGSGSLCISADLQTSLGTSYPNGGYFPHIMMDSKLVRAKSGTEDGIKIIRCKCCGMVLKAVKELAGYTVTFKELDGTLIDVKQVKEGEAVEAPVIEKEGFSLSWNVSLANITKDTLAIAQWTKKQYEVYFLDAEGKFLKKDVVGYKEKATAPIITKTGYTLSWNKSFDCVTETLVVSAKWISNDPSKPDIGGDSTSDSSSDTTSDTSLIDINKATISISSSTYQYDGKEKKPSVTVSYGNTKLSQDKDYIVLYYNNTAVGNAIVTIQGIGNYSGKKDIGFAIVSNLSNVDASEETWNDTTYAWNANLTECIATRVSKNDSKKSETCKAKITTAVGVDATCTSTGIVNVTATFDKTWASTQIKQKTSAALGHDFSSNSKYCKRCLLLNPNFEEEEKSGYSPVLPDAYYHNYTTPTKATDGCMVTTNSDGTATITELKNMYGSVVEVPSSVKVNGVTYTVTELGSRCLKNVKDANTIKIPSSVQKIKAKAFSGTKISKIIISVKKGAKLKVSKKAFKNSKVKYVEINMSKSSTKKEQQRVVNQFKKAGIK